jgi:uncharacterized protein (TIGR02246 family)
MRSRSIVASVAAALLLGILTTAHAQNVDAELKKLAEDFSQAWAKGDAKGIAALHTQDAIRLPGDGTVVTGRAAIEQNYVPALSGPFQGSKLAIRANPAKQVTPDVYVGEGTYQVTGTAIPPGAPSSGQYLNTYVRQGGRWLIASSVVIPSR